MIPAPTREHTVQLLGTARATLADIKERIEFTERQLVIYRDQALEVENLIDYYEQTLLFWDSIKS